MGFHRQAKPLRPADLIRPLVGFAIAIAILIGLAHIH